MCLRRPGVAETDSGFCSRTKMAFLARPCNIAQRVCVSLFTAYCTIMSQCNYTQALSLSLLPKLSNHASERCSAKGAIARWVGTKRRPSKTHGTRNSARNSARKQRKEKSQDTVQETVSSQKEQLERRLEASRTSEVNAVGGLCCAPGCTYTPVRWATAVDPDFCTS